MPARVHVMFVVAASSAAVLLVAHLWAAKLPQSPLQAKARSAQVAAARP